MSLFTSYAPPSVYTTEVFLPQAANAPGTARIPVIIGEGQQYFTFPNVELFRGSSAIQDDQAVNENISDQVLGFGRNFVTTYHPVVDGTGKGITTNDPTMVQVLSIDSDGNATPVTVISLNGATGAFATQDIIPTGTSLYLTYYFKRGDTQIVDENLAPQIPSFATLMVLGGATSPPLSPPVNSTSLILTTTLPGVVGNLITLEFVQAVSGEGVPDAQAVIGAGTDDIVIELRNTDNSLRNLVDIQNLINNASIPTLDAGYLAVMASATGAGVILAGPPQSFTGGIGQSTNTVFKVANVPITDGTNGGIVTTDPLLITVEEDGNLVPVASLNGQQGLITLASPVASGSTLTVTYYTNTWQNTFDLLPASNVASIVEIGLGPNRFDFTEGVDYVLGTDSQGNGTINWGASVSSAIGVDNAGDTAFSPADVNTGLVDDQVFLLPVTGAVNGKNTVFTLPDTPVDGSGLARITDNPTLVQIYVGSDPLEAFFSGTVPVAQLSGSAEQVTLFNPPPAGTKVFASFYRSILTDNNYTLTVVNPGFSGFGTYSVVDELSRPIPLVTFQSGSVTDNDGFSTTGVVYPFGYAGATTFTGDAQSIPGASSETVTLTFNDDGIGTVVPAVQASVTLTFSGATLTLTATNPGTLGNNVQVAVDASSTSSEPVVVNGDLITIYGNWDGGGVYTTAQIAAYFPSADTNSGGNIRAVAGGPAAAVTTTGATSLTGGTNAVTAPVSHSYMVSSSLGVKGSSGVGYLDQTYIDVKTGFRVTIVNPADSVNYGVLSIPNSYVYQPGDTLLYVVSSMAVRHTGSPGVFPAEYNNLVALSGIRTEVIGTLGATTGDTVVVTTFTNSGNNPNVGEFYYVTFTTAKTAADMACQIFTNPSDAYAQYGQPSTINRLSLGIQLMSLNGVQTFGAIQVPVQPGLNTAASSDYLAALQQLTKHLPGTNRKADVVVPLSNDPTVHQALSRQLTTQATARYKGEAIGFVGYSQFTTAAQATANAVSLDNQRVIAIGNPAAGILITNPQTGVAIEYPVDGPFMAAAMAGLNCNPANDVATTLTLQNLIGFSRLLITYDDPTMDSMAAGGVTLLLNNNGALQIRHYKSTDPSNDLTSEPTSTTIADFVAQQFRRDLQQFIGRKLVDSLVTDISIVCNARLVSLMNNTIINGYENLTVVVNSADPTEVDVTVTFKPIFSLLYLSVTFVVQTSL